MRKIIYIALSIALFGFIFSGCSKKDDTTSPDTDGNSDQTTQPSGDGSGTQQDGENGSGGQDLIAQLQDIYIVGSATLGGGQFPVPDPEQKISKKGENIGVFETILYLKSEGNFVFRLTNNNQIDTTIGINEDEQLVAENWDSIPSPDSDGWYTVSVNLLDSSYVLEDYDSNTDPNPNIIPDSLIITGNAVAGGWANPVDEQYLSDQTFTKLNAYEFSLTIDLKADSAYKIISTNAGSWTNELGIEELGVKDASADPMGDLFQLKVQAGTAEDIPAPTEDGTYKIDINFLNYHYTLTEVD